MGLGTRDTPENRDRDMSWTSLALVRLGRDKQSRPWERQQDLRSYNHKVLFCLLVLFWFLAVPYGLWCFGSLTRA